MPRKKKKNKKFLGIFVRKTKTKTKRAREIENSWHIEVDEHIARELFGVMFLFIGITLTLSQFDQLGRIGEGLNYILKPVFGYGIYALSIMCISLGVSCFASKTIKLNAAKFTGLGLLLISSLSLSHLFVNLGDILVAAQLGQAGGYIGFITNYLFRGVLEVSTLGSGMIFGIILLISVSLTFNTSILNILKSVLIFKVVSSDEQATEKINKKTTKEKPEEKTSIIQKLSQVNKKPEATINIIKPNLASSKSNKTADILPTLFDEKLQVKPQENTQTPEDASTLEKEIEWEYPKLDLLDNTTDKVETKDSFLRANASNIQQKLDQFDISVSMCDVHVGPTVIQYTLKPDDGVKLSKITNLKNDLALALAAKSLRIEAPIPGKSLVGIEVPSEKRITVKLREVMESSEFLNSAQTSKLTLPLGRDVSGKPIVAELADMPHLLIAGATNSGKSVCINTFLCSLLYQNSPSDLKMILVDPKQVELKDYDHLPHLLTPVITNPDKASNALKWAVAEMNRRYKILSEAGARNIQEYNSNKKAEEKKMPKILILIDELADLMMANGKEIEASICRIAQMARAVGMHLIIATQRPSVDVITGLIKANIPSRISFSVSSAIDSRTILDSQGAEDLLGKGDMLFLQKDYSKPRRVQGIYVAPTEIKKLTNFLKLRMEPDFKPEIVDKNANKAKMSPTEAANQEDELYTKAYQTVIENRKASASLLQRRLKVGYARAARLLDLLEENGIVGPVNGAKPREIYVQE
jgi:DNA segregation ATPase FtsK/SpoIIIE, S-DNA-T family